LTWNRFGRTGARKCENLSARLSAKRNSSRYPPIMLGRKMVSDVKPISRAIVIDRTKGFLRSCLFDRCAGRRDCSVGSPPGHLRQQQFQLWSHWVHQPILLGQWSPGWRYDLCDRWPCKSLGQRISAHQPRRSEHQDLHSEHPVKLRTVSDDNPRESARACPTPLASSCRT
jgi:hypothetical protein